MALAVGELSSPRADGTSINSAEFQNADTAIQLTVGGQRQGWGNFGTVRMARP